MCAEGQPKSVAFFDVIDDLTAALNNPQKTQVVVPPDGLSVDSGELIINGVEISKEQDRPDVSTLLQLINNESQRTKVVAHLNETGGLVIENVDGYESDVIVFGAAPGLLKDVVGTSSPAIVSRLW